MNCKMANSTTSYQLNQLLRNEMSSCTAPSTSVSIDALPSCRRPLGRPRNVAASLGITPVRYGRIASSAYADDGRGWSWEKRDGNGSEEEVGGGDEGVDAGNRKVQCEVEVVSWRERRIRAHIWVDADVKSVWDALTDYERLADFIPNLVFSGRIPCPYPGRIWLEQRGLQRALYWHIEARVVLDLREVYKSAKERELCFSMVDGDFKKFEGKWSMKAGPRSSSTLSYEVNVIPRFNFPAIFLERIIRSDLPVNLQALAIRAEKRSEGTQKLILTVNSVGRVPNGDHSSISNKLDGSLSSDNELSEGELKDSITSINAVHSPPTTTAINSKWAMFGKVCRLDHPCMVDEVHLRRLDGLLEDGVVHRCVVASITVKAPVHEVWNVLTAYESLPEIVPNLAISKVLSRENNRVRILQEGCKGLLYMVLHARVILDLREHLEREISFEQVEGDFDSFQGKWIFEQLGNQHTLLKYTVESKMHKDSLLSEAIMEEVIYEDLPSNLCVIRDYIENKDGGTTVFETTTETEHTDNDVGPHPSGIATEDYAECGPRSSSTRRPRVPGLQRDIEILKSELTKFISEHGQEGFMPMRKQLRLHGRVDIDKAITRMGGFRRIASLMNLSLAYKHRKPKGYWDHLEHLEEEIRRFQRSWGMDPSYMPSRKSFERAGRYDIARALEKWGGLHEVSRLLSLKLRHPNRQAALARDKTADSVTTTDSEKLEKPSPEPNVSQDTQKWLSQLKHLDINWVE